MYNTLFKLTGTDNIQNCIVILQQLVTIYHQNQNDQQTKIAITNIAQTFKQYTGSELTTDNMLQYFNAVKMKMMHLES